MKKTIALLLFGLLLMGTTWVARTIIWDGTDSVAVNVDGSLNAVVTATNLDIGNVDTIGTSIVPGTAAANLGKAEDGAHASGDTGVLALGVRNDAAPQADRTSTTGDYSALATDVKGNVLVAGNLAHDAADAGNPIKIGGKAATSAPTAVSNGDRVDAYFDTNGRLAVQDGGGSLTVDVGTSLPTGANAIGSIVAITTSVTPGTAAANLGKAEDGAHASGDVGAMALGVRNDDLGTSLSGTNGDYTPVAVGSDGALYQGLAKSTYGTLSNIGTTYNNVTTTAVSQDVTCKGYKHAAISLEYDKSNTPTDIQVEIWESLDGTNYAKRISWGLGTIILSDDHIGASGKDYVYSWELAAEEFRVNVIATGTDATNTFTIANPRYHLRT